MQSRSMLLRRVLILAAALVLAVLQARPGAAQRACLGFSSGPGVGPSNDACVAGGNTLTFLNAADSVFPGGEMITIKLFAGTISVSPTGQGLTATGVRVTTNYIPAGAASDRTRTLAANSPSFAVTVETGSTTVKVSSTSAASLTVQPMGGGSPVTINPGCTVTFTTSGASLPSCS